MQSITVPSVLSPKPHTIPTNTTCTLSLVGPRFILDANHTGYKSLLGKAPPYLSSLVTIAAPTRSTRSSRYISLVTPKRIPTLVIFPSSSLLPMTGMNCKDLWSWRLISPSLALSTSYQSSSQITEPVHSPSVNSPSIYLPHPHTVFIYLSCSFAPQYLYLHINLLHIYHSSV